MSTPAPAAPPVIRIKRKRDDAPLEVLRRTMTKHKGRGVGG
jgi:hypothetical protein